MSTFIDTLARMTPQKPLAEVAKQCDIIFADRPLPIDFPTEIVNDPFRSGLDHSSKHKKTSLVVIGRYFTKVSPDARWMRSLRLYQSIQEDLRVQQKGAEK